MRRAARHLAAVSCRCLICLIPQNVMTARIWTNRPLVATEDFTWGLA
jgi:hypothetical protein